MNIYIQKLVSADIASLLPTLLDHERLSRFFNATFKVIKHQNQQEVIGGKGCQREVSTRGECFVEEIVKADLSGIQYEIVGKGPLDNHLGDISFEVVDGGTIIHYNIKGDVVGWVPEFLFAMVLKHDIAGALNKLAKHFETTKGY